jgi:hypothetical protein
VNSRILDIAIVIAALGGIWLGISVFMLLSA